MLFLTAASAVVVGVLLTLAAGAQRTATAPERYTAKYVGGVDVTVFQLTGRPLTAAVARLPAVSSVDSLTFVFGGLSRSGPARVGTQESIVANLFAGSVRPAGAHIVAGRAADPNTPGEFVATRALLRSSGAKVGDPFTLTTLTQEQADTNGFAAPHPAGPVVKATLVGIIEAPDELDDPSATAIFSPSLITDERLGISATPMAVGLRRGAGASELRSQLATLAPSKAWTVEKAQFVSPTVRAAVRGQAEGLLAVAVVAGIAALVVLGQLITRQVRLPAEEESKLRALGMTRTQVITETMARAVVPIVVGATLGTVLSVVPSGRFPTGFVRRLEPDPGQRIDWKVLGLGVVVSVVALLAWTLVALMISRRVSSAQRSSTIADAVASRCRSASMSIGMRFAFTRGGSDPGGVRGATAGLALATICLGGALTFGSSLTRLVGEPWRYGNNFPLAFGEGENELPPTMTSQLEADRDVSGLTYYGLATATSGKSQIWLAGYRTARGHLTPTLLEGRIPTADDEIALGRLEARTLHAKVGGDVAIDVAGKHHTFHVTGLAVIPSIGGNNGIGQDGLVTLPALTRLDHSVKVANATVAVRPGAPPGTIERVWRRGINWDSKEPLPAWTGSPPPVIVDVARIRSTPYLLVGVLGTLVALTIGHTVWSSVRRRRRDAAILRSIGADRRFVSRAMHWQATAIVLVPVLIGLLVGVAAGVRVFRVFADAMGVVDGAAIPVLAAGGTLVASLLVSNVVSGVAARRIESGSPADLLRTE